jgi:hypothetical protein
MPFINKPLCFNTALFRFNEAINKALTNIMVSRQMQTEIFRKLTVSTGLGIYPSATGVTDCVELYFTGSGGQIFLIGWKVTGST